MADITMCIGKTYSSSEGKDVFCPLKEQCHRYVAIPEKHDQTYWIHLPFDFVKNSCNYFWNVDINPDH